MIKKSFLGVRFKGVEDAKKVFEKSRSENIPVIICMNHSNWWDAAIVVWLSIRYFKVDAYCFMEQKQLEVNKFFKSLGAIPIVRENPRQSVMAIEFAVSILRNSDKVVWIFPQGEIVPNDNKPYRFFSGVHSLISKVEKVFYVKLFFEYRFTSEQRPEVFIDFMGSELIEKINLGAKKEFISELEREFERTHEKVLSDVIQRNYDDYKVILAGKRSIDRKP